MSKPDNLGIIVFLGVLVMCLCTVVFILVLDNYKKDGQFKHQQRESERAALALRESREKLERLLKAVQDTEKGRE